jgi:hypothetical protein
MANAAKTVEARQKWNDLAAELRHKADLQDGLATVIPPAEAEPEAVPASKDSATQPDAPSHGEPLRPQSDLGSEPEATPPEPVAVSGFKEAPPSELGDTVRRDQSASEDMTATEKQMPPIEHQPADHATPEEIGTADPEWEELIAGIRSKTRSNEPD